MTDLKPCPNPFHECGTSHIKLFREPDYGFQMHCTYCGIATDWCESAESAAEAWNTRPASVPVDDLRGALKDAEWAADDLSHHQKAAAYDFLSKQIAGLIDQAERREGS